MKRNLLLCVLLLAAAFRGQAQEAKTVYYHNPSWSPNGKRIVFESNRDGKFAIYTIAANGSDLRKLTDGQANDEQPRWSKDGRKIVFISDRDGEFDIYLMRKDGSSQVRITAGNEGRFIPDLSPRCDRLVFASGDDTFLVGIGGKNETKLPNGGENLRWSPDGKKILFSKTEPIPQNVVENMPKMTRDERREVLAKRDSSSEIFVMNADGSLAAKLTDNNAKDNIAEWSGNGKHIYFISLRDGPPKVFVMNSNGSNTKPIADGKLAAGTSVSPDERSFIYSKQKDGKYGVYIYDITAKTERLLIGQ